MKNNTFCQLLCENTPTHHSLREYFKKMKFKLILSKSDSSSRSLLLLPYDISNLQPPITIQRDQKVEEEIKPVRNIFSKKKSEIQENFDPEYEQLLDEEKEPLSITGNDGRSFNGRYLDNTKDSYFVFINTGKSFKVIPLKKWYKFSQKVNYDVLSLEEAESLLKEKNILDEGKKWMMHNRKAEEGIDFDEVFDDDNSDEVCIQEEETEELTKSGQEITKILQGKSSEQPNGNLSENIQGVEEHSSKTEKKQPSPIQKSTSPVLKESDLRELFSHEELTIKSLINKLKKRFKITEQFKQTVQRFIKEECGARKEIIDGQSVKILYLKKK